MKQFRPFCYFVTTVVTLSRGIYSCIFLSGPIFFFCVHPANAALSVYDVFGLNYRRVASNKTCDQIEKTQKLYLYLLFY